MNKLFFLLLLPILIFGQFHFIPLSGDYASFQSTDSLAYLEVYLSIFQGSIEYIEDENGKFTATFTNKLELSNESGIVESMTHNYQNSFEDTTSAYIYNQFVDIFLLEVPYGTYKAKLEIQDNSSLKKGEYIFDVKTIEPSADLSLSDIEICSHLSVDTSKSIYFKNGLKVVPNPRKIYDILQPMLYFYVEINNLSYNPEQINQYEFSYAVTSNQGDTVKTRKPITKQIAGERLVEVGAMNVMALQHNPYFLNVRVKDNAIGKEITGRKLFQVYKPTKEIVSESQDQNEIITGIYGQFTKEDLENEFAIARYMASRDEEKVFKKLETADAMKAFLVTFWQTRDKIYRTGPGEYRKSYMNRVEIANERFRSMGRAGWKTDRGRALLLYGEPDEYERFPSSMDALPYIIWHYYDLEGSQIFVFTDMDGFGDYRQIHSTYRRELQNHNWQNIIAKSGGSGF